MDRRKRMILGWTLPAGAWIAAQLAAPAPCRGQAAASQPVRPSASSSVRGQATIPAPARFDEDVERSHFHESQPSPQSQPPVPAKSPSSYAPPAPTPPPQYPAYAPQYPSYAPPQYPSYAPQYVMVPMMPPPAAAPPAMAPPAAPPANLFLPSAAPAYGMVPPTAAAPPMPMMPMMPMMAPAAPPAPAAMTGSAVSVPTSSSRTVVEVRGPGLIGASLARVGERLVQLGRTRVRTVQETTLQTPQSQSAGGTATISTAGLVPLQPPQQAAPPQAAPPENAPPPGPVPSPQGEETHSKIHHLFGHD